MWSFVVGFAATVLILFVVWSSDSAAQALAIELRPVECSNGLGIVRVDIENTQSETATFVVEVSGVLSGFGATKEIELDSTKSGVVGFSGRPDGLYTVRVSLNGTPVAVFDGFQEVDGQLRANGPVVHCGSDDAVIVADGCGDSGGYVIVSMRNTTAAQREVRVRVWYETQVVDDQADADFGGIERSATVAPQATTLEFVGGRTQDIGVLMAGRSGPVGFSWLDGFHAGSGAVLVDCAGAPSEVGVLVSCLDFNGRLDVFVNRTPDLPAMYVVEFRGVGEFSKTTTIDLTDEQVGRATTTGRPDGVYDISVSRASGGQTTEVVVVPSAVVVSCDLQPTVEVTVRSTCLGGAGRLDVGLGNVGDATASYLVRVESGQITPRTRLVEAAERSTLSFTGRPDGPIGVTVERDGSEIYSEVVFVACELAPEPTPPPVAPSPTPVTPTPTPGDGPPLATPGPGGGPPPLATPGPGGGPPTTTPEPGGGDGPPTATPEPGGGDGPVPGTPEPGGDGPPIDPPVS